MPAQGELRIRRRLWQGILRTESGKRKARDVVPREFVEQLRSRAQFGHMLSVIRYIERRPRMRISGDIVTDVDVELYHVDFRSYMQFIPQNMLPNESELAEHFVQGLNSPPVERLVRQRQPRSVAEALSAAVDVANEAARAAELVPMFRDDAGRSGYRQNRGRGYSQPRDDRQASRGATRGGDRNPPGSSSEPYCVGCKKRGHFSSQCRNHAGNPRDHPGEIERGMTCKYCMKRGHALQNCTLKNTEGYRKWRNHKGGRPDEAENRDRRGRKRPRFGDEPSREFSRRRRDDEEDDDRSAAGSDRSNATFRTELWPRPRPRALPRGKQV
jgi:hypothetical protein